MLFIADINNTQAAAEATEILADWANEHERYYARHWTTIKGGPFKGKGAGFAATAAGGSWLTSGGNYTALDIIRDETGQAVGVRIMARGARHGLGGLELAEKYERHLKPLVYETHCRDMRPWETMQQYLTRVVPRTGYRITSISRRTRRGHLVWWDVKDIPDAQETAFTRGLADAESVRIKVKGVEFTVFHPYDLNELGQPGPGDPDWEPDYGAEVPDEPCEVL